MEIKIAKIHEHTIAEAVLAEAVSKETILQTIQDAVDVMANAYYQGAEYVLLYEENLPLTFFDLKTGIAGEILQKYSTYQMKLIIVGDFEKFESATLQAFISESNRGNQIAFVKSREAALEKMLNTK